MGERHLGRLALSAFERQGDRPALLFEGRWHTSGELIERSRRLAGGLASIGVGPGDRVVVTMANCPEVTIAYQAVWIAGAVVCPAVFLLPAGDLRHVVGDAQAAAVITTPELAARVIEAVDGLDPAPALLCTEPVDRRLQALSELEQEDPAPLAQRGDDDLAALLYTGGTTGRAKGVMLSHANLWFSGQAAHEVAYVPGVVRTLTALPLSHAYGILVTLAGMHVPEPTVNVLMRWFEPSQWLALIEEHRLQHTAVVPTMLQVLLAEPLEERDLSSLSWISCGGAPLPQEVERAFRERLPHVSVRQGYGLTETAALLTTNPTGAERPGSVGLPVPGVQLEIRDDAGRPVPRGEIGEVCARSPGIMSGYWRSPEATAEALDGGWLRTGDLGRLDEDGYLYIVDRRKDLIIRGGFNVYPRDVEDALVRHPDVQMAGVVGRPSERHGEEVVAFVSARPGHRVDPPSLIEWAREHIGGYRYPREVHVLESIPLTPVGKVDRKALRALLGGPGGAGSKRAATAGS